ncbi:hypothetical protein D3C85_239220 [compost metagenome]
MLTRKSFGIIKNTNTESKHEAIGFLPDGEYRMGSYAFRPIKQDEQVTTVLHLEVVTAIGEEQIVKSVYEVREYSLERDRWQPCVTPYVTPFCIRTEAFVGMQQYLRRREHPEAKVIHAEYFVEYVA